MCQRNFEHGVGNVARRGTMGEVNGIFSYRTGQMMEAAVVERTHQAGIILLAVARQSLGVARIDHPRQRVAVQAILALQFITRVPIFQGKKIAN